MVVTRKTPKPNVWWTCGTVAIIVALGLLWLVLEGSSGDTTGTSGPSAGLNPTTDTLHSEPLALRGWELGHLPPSLALAPAEAVNENRDNLTVLTLASSGALAITGLALLLAWTTRPNRGWRAQVQKSQLPGIPRRASSF